MLRTVACQTLRAATSPARYCCSTESPARRLRHIVQQEINIAQSDPANCRVPEQRLSAGEWAVKYHELQVRVQKTVGDYCVIAVANAKTSIPAVEGGKVALENLTPATIFLKKGNSKLVLVGEYILSADNYHLEGIAFCRNLEGEVQARAGRQASEYLDYRGPRLDGLEGKLIDTIRIFIEDMGLDQQFFAHLYQLCVAHEQKFFIEWLKDLNSLL